jgi:hypothetical protein
MGQWIVVEIDSEFRIWKETKPENEFYPPKIIWTWHVLVYWAQPNVIFFWKTLQDGNYM